MAHPPGKVDSCAVVLIVLAAGLTGIAGLAALLVRVVVS